MRQPTVLFVCTGNAGRSQIAEALLRRHAGRAMRVFSGGVEPWKHLHPMAVKIAGERGLSMDGQHPKHVGSLVDSGVDLIVTIGDAARHRTPVFPGNPRRVHWDIPDPADADGTQDSEKVFRRTIGEIERRIPDVEKTLFLPRAAEFHLAPGISTVVTGPGDLVPRRHIPQIAGAGFRCVELGFCSRDLSGFPWKDPDAVRALKRICDDTGVVIYSVHAEGTWLPRPDPGENRDALDTAFRFADLAAELGAHYVPIHLGLPAGMDSGKGRELLASTLEELTRHALSLPCRFAWENEAMGLSGKEQVAWVRELNPGGLGFVFDTGHANLQKNTDEYLPAVGSCLCGLHINDNRGDRDIHLPPGQGTYPWGEFLKKVLDTGYIRPLMVETICWEQGGDLRPFFSAALEGLKM